jgi:anti-sigma regulatory factor (Ser/Thr protein kinase)
MNTRSAGTDCLWRVVALRAVPQAVADGRRWARETVREWRLGETADVVQQLASELVTNSVEHAQTSSVRVLLMFMAGTLRLDVADDDVVSLPVRAQPSVDDVSGRGLAIVEALSDRWGVRITRCAKSVWCELAAAPAFRGFGGRPPGLTLLDSWRG